MPVTKIASTTFPNIAIVDVLGKGKGVIAKEDISRGTLIVSEKPRITLPRHPSQSTNTLSNLSREDSLFLLSFPCGPDEHPIFGRRKHFTPCVGDDAVGSGLCPTICRVNHTCYSPKGRPNAAYFWNVNSKHEELWAIKEIQAGQEIEVSYMEDIENYQNPLVLLRQKFGFQCSCPGCARSAAEQTESERRIRAYNDFVRDLPSRFGPESPLEILRDIETQVLIICEEGYTGEVGARAHDAFQLCAYYGDADSAKKWEAICRDCHALYHGRSESFEKARRLAAKPQDFRAWGQLGRRKLRGPSKQVLEYCYPETQMMTNATPSGIGSSSSAVALTPQAVVEGTPTIVAPAAISHAISTAGKLSKGQKKNAKAKAKKEAAKLATQRD
ncbi:hypothetical protein B0H16DRAFT_1365477 [Mycena metata]|uniref:SET domain-containing protein n=1 Tax=Mycena metata TaxID=1033252 RepID=A0AAD7NNR1_9AGAR|nr:hypothetical protein B0H16DRAFT_1365477 [Mycena metata]